MTVAAFKEMSKGELEDLVLRLKHRRDKVDRSMEELREEKGEISRNLNAASQSLERLIAQDEEEARLQEAWLPPALASEWPGGAPAVARDAEELVRWLAFRLKADDRMIHPNFVLLGDLNLDFERIQESHDDMDAFLRGLNEAVFRRADANRIYFPFIDRHPATGEVFRTTPSGKQTYDHIAFFRAKTEHRFPQVEDAASAGSNGPDGFDYGLFNFFDLIAMALFDAPYQSLAAQQKSHVKERTEHLLSDHMPIWVRVPRPGFTA